MPEVVIYTAEKAERVKALATNAVTFIANSIGIKIEAVNTKEVDLYVDAMGKNENAPVKFCIKFESFSFYYIVKCGKKFNRERFSTDIVENKAIKDKRKVMDNLIQHGAATKAQLNAMTSRGLI